MIIEYFLNFLIKKNVLFIKLFQTMSSNKNVSPHMLHIFQKCTNNVAFSDDDIDFDLLNKILIDYNIELESNIPINSGMIALVFKGKFKNSDKSVVIKMAKLNIYERVENGYNNIVFFYKILRFILYPFDSYTNTLDTLKNFIDSKDYLLSQCKFNHEIETMICIKKELSELTNTTNIKNIEKIVIPEIYNKNNDNAFIVMEFINGTDIFKISPVDKVEYAKLLILIIVIQIFFTSKIHTDPHPGNIICFNNSKGEKYVALIDFGMNINVNQDLRDGLIKMLSNVIQVSDVSPDYTKCLSMFLSPRIDFSNYIELHKPINVIMQTLTQSLISGNLTETDVFIHLNNIISLHSDFKILKMEKEIVQLLIGISCLNSSTNILTDYNKELIRTYYKDILIDVLSN